MKLENLIKFYEKKIEDNQWMATAYAKDGLYNMCGQTGIENKLYIEFVKKLKKLE